MFATALALTMLTSDFQLKNGDRVLFYGDSITEQRLYTTYVETFVRTRYPKLDIEFFTSGVGGDNTWGGWMGDINTRTTRDVAPFKPNHITVMLGMNDAGYVPFNQKIYDTYREWYDKLLAALRKAAPGFSLTLIKESPYDEIAHEKSDFPGYSKTVDRFGEYVRELAAKEKTGFADLCSPVTDLLNAVVKIDKEGAKQILPDAIHPGPSGHLVMAGALLKSWGVDPVVSALHLDGAQNSVVSKSKTQIELLGPLKWRQTDECLPFPHDPAYDLALRHSSFSRDLNRQSLQVDHLAAGQYALAIDGKQVAKWSADQLAAGIDLAMLDTPMARQAKQVLAWATKRNEAFHTRQFNVNFWFGELPETKEALAALDKVERAIHRQEVAAAVPKPHEFALLKLD